MLPWHEIRVYDGCGNIYEIVDIIYSADSISHSGGQTLADKLVQRQAQGLLLVIQPFAQSRRQRKIEIKGHVEEGACRAFHARIEYFCGNPKVSVRGEAGLERKPEGFELAAWTATTDRFWNDGAEGLDETSQLRRLEAVALIYAGPAQG